jgi:hypothetical protein
MRTGIIVKVTAAECDRLKAIGCQRATSRSRRRRRHASGTQADAIEMTYRDAVREAIRYACTVTKAYLSWVNRGL